jgi:hypothetical protein
MQTRLTCIYSKVEALESVCDHDRSAQHIFEVWREFVSTSGDLTRCLNFYIKRQDLLESTAKLDQDLFAKFYFDYTNKF